MKYRQYLVWIAGSVALACSSGSGNTGPGAGGNGAGTGTGASPGSGANTGSGGGGAGISNGGASAVDCLNRCEAGFSACGQPASQCGQLCASLSEAQLLCLEGANCDPVVAEGCINGGGSGGGTAGFGATGGSSGGTKKLGQPCECPDEGDFVSCTDPCISGLTCVEFAGDKFCTEKCSAGDSCGAGLSCTELLIGSVSLGAWCR